ncbi:hypothetical protein Dsin_033142 [Dipteronia sinensis]|uniref:Autophagy-related protein 9 n=1 Tax=Dipteronia sinensis TaxID=43782 RepID=A0AAE0DJN8_9ROSI|nr:hypothetical protein Dsin_033142 [Dipteronia sinensis]
MRGFRAALPRAAVCRVYYYAIVCRIAVEALRVRCCHVDIAFAVSSFYCCSYYHYKAILNVQQAFFTMMTSNLLARFRPATEPAATSIYETIRQHDDDSDGSDVEERAGLALDVRNLEEDTRDYDPHDAQSVYNNLESVRRDDIRAGKKTRTRSSKVMRKLGKSRRVQRGRDLVDVEEADDDVPASLLIEGAVDLQPHELENLPPPPHQTSPEPSLNNQTRTQWERAQAAQELHPNARITSTRQFARTTSVGTALAMADPREKAMWRWANVQNLDNFLYDVYNYYLNHGFWSIMLQRAISLLTVAFIVGFFIFLTQCVNYRKVKGSKELPEILVPRCTSQMGFFPNALLWFTTFFWIYKVFQYIVDIRRLIHLHNFYHHLLGVPEEEIQSISWQEVVSRLMALRDSNPNITSSTGNKPHKFLGTQNKQRMDAHDIANRLMRRENYMVAMINKDILDMTLPVPRLRNKQLFTRTLEWNINQCIMQYVFNPQGQIRQLFLKDTHRRALSEGLKRRFVFAGTMNLLIAPFLIGYFVLETFFQYFNEYQKNPAQIGHRRYNVLAEWKFREFNELWHLFQRRLNMSHPFAMRYINQFPKDKTVQAARFVALVSGAIVSILGVATILDQENFLSFEITPGRTTIFYLGVFGTIWAIARGLLPDDNMVYDSSFSMEEVIDFTHYRPAHWEGRLHTIEVKTDFEKLYQMQIAIFIEELLSMVFTPFVLWFSLPKCSDQIIDFFREFTVHVDGVGYICSFAEFNFKKPGNTIPSSTNTRAKDQTVGLRDEYFSTKDQKLEQSYWGFMNDYARNPKTDIRFPYREANVARRRFNMPPPFPGLPSPQLHPHITDPSSAGVHTTARQSHMLSPRKTFGFQPSSSKYLAHATTSPLHSVLLDPHHLPINTSQVALGSPQALRPRHVPSTTFAEPRKPNKARTDSSEFDGLKREETITSTISEEYDNPPDDLMAGDDDHKKYKSPQVHLQQERLQQQSTANVQSEVMGSWKKAEEADDLDDSDEHEDDITALTGERAGVLGLIKQFQRAQGEGTRTGTGIQ